MTLIIVLIILVLLILWFISVQRNLVASEERCKNALSQIGVQQNSRWDALTAIADQIRSYDEHEYNTLKDVIAQRKPINQNSTAEEAQAQENLLNQAMGRLNVVVEKYPDLKANELYVKSLDAINQYENQVRLSRMVYNDSVTKYNQLIRQIPSSFVASMLHFTVRDYLEEPQGKTEMPNMR
jgi:Uncharacterized conserved protein